MGVASRYWLKNPQTDESIQCCPCSVVTAVCVDSNVVDIDDHLFHDDINCSEWSLGTGVLPNELAELFIQIEDRINFFLRFLGL